MISRGILVLLSVVVATALAGCSGWDIFQQDKKIKQLSADLTAARADAKSAKKNLSDTRDELARKQKQIDTLVALGPVRLEKLNHVKVIKLGQYTGGADLDAQDGDDGIKVFLRPIDARGDTIKASGSLTVQLYDLAQPPDKTLIGEYKWSVDEVSKAFSGGFLTYHFTFTCPWKSGPPKHDEITIRVEFVDYLTGKTMQVQKICKVDLPAK